MKNKKIKIYYGKAIYGKEEISAVNKVLKNKSLALTRASQIEIKNYRKK